MVAPKYLAGACLDETLTGDSSSVGGCWQEVAEI